MARRKAPLIPDALLDQLLAGRDPQSALGQGGLLDELKRALAERAPNAEMDHHLGGEAADGRSNSRNGYGRKTVLTETGKLPIAVPRDRLATFEPQLIAKYRRRLPVDQLCRPTDDKAISMYARGLSVREIQAHLAELYGIDVSPDLISAVTDAILDEVAQWQDRPLEAVYPLVFFDALRVKIRDEGTVRNKAVYLALGVRAAGRKEILGLWIEQTASVRAAQRTAASLTERAEPAGAKFWLRVMNELKNRSVEDILIAVVDGLKGFPDAITAVFPQAQVQTCIVHLIRNSLALCCGLTRPAATVPRTLQGSQGGRGRAEGDLPGQGRRCRCCRPGGVRHRRLGPQIPDDRPVLAAPLGGGDPVLRLPGRCPPDRLHHQRHRGPERQAAPGGPHPRPLPQRRGRPQAALPGLEPRRAGVENAAQGMGPCQLR